MRELIGACEGFAAPPLLDEAVFAQRDDVALTPTMAANDAQARAGSGYPYRFITRSMTDKQFGPVSTVLLGSALKGRVRVPNPGALHPAACAEVQYLCAVPCGGDLALRHGLDHLL